MKNKLMYQEILNKCDFISVTIFQKSTNYIFDNKNKSNPFNFNLYSYVNDDLIINAMEKFVIGDNV